MSPAAGAAMFALGLVIVIVGFLVVVTYNAIVALRNRIAKAWANIDVALRQRHDQLPNLVEAVRGLMAYERDVLEAVTRARTAYSPAAPIPAQAATSEATTAAVRQLFAVVERYPEIKSAANVLALQAEVVAARGRHRRPARALQRPGLPLQHPDPAAAREPARGAVRVAAAAVLRGRRRGAGASRRRAGAPRGLIGVRHGRVTARA